MIDLNPIYDTKLSEIELGVIAEISDNTRLQVSFIDYSDKISSAPDAMNQDANLNRMPYRPDFRIPVRASIQLLPQMNLTLTADVIGERKKSLLAEDLFPTFALFHADLNYEVNENLNALLSVRNLLDTKYTMWEGYQEMGIVVLAGVRAHF